MIAAGIGRLCAGRRVRGVGIAGLAGLGVLTGTLLGGRSGGGHPARDPGLPVVVVAHAVRAGRPIDPRALRVVRLPAAAVPRGALRDVAAAALRVAAVDLPPGMPVADALLRDGGGSALLAPGERAVGLRVDEASSVGGALGPGGRADVVAVRGGLLRTLATDVRIAAVGGRTADGERRLVVVHVPAAQALLLAAADLGGLELRLLARSGT